MTSLAERFMQVFEGNMDAHGTYTVEEKNSTKGKVEIKKGVRTLKQPVTVELWEKHLAGKIPLGVIPIRQDNTCIWGCVDIDTYPLDHITLAQRIAKLKMPLMVCGSKSGGAHLFLFTKDPVPAVDMRRKLQEFASSLGHGSCEIFPKQTQIDHAKGDVGNWLNMPYYGGVRTTKRHAYSPRGEVMSPEEFLAEVNRLAVEDLDNIEVESPTLHVSDEFADAPPCLQILIGEGFPQGTRNNGLYALAVFARKAFGEKDAVNKIRAYNERYLQPPLEADEVDEITRNVVGKVAKGKRYNYKCTDHPCISYCNKGLCLTRKHGVGADGTPMPTFKPPLTILEGRPRAYFVDADMGDGEIKRVDYYDIADLNNPIKFRNRAMDVCGAYFPEIKGDSFHKLMQALWYEPIKIEAGDELTELGQLQTVLETFCTAKKGNHRQDIRRGKAFLEDGYYWFDITKFWEHLQKVGGLKLEGGKTQLVTILKQLGVETNKQLKVGQKNVKLYRVPERNVSDEIQESIPLPPDDEQHL